MNRQLSIPKSAQLELGTILQPYVSANNDLNRSRFEFLNREFLFENFIDWNYLNWGRLWCYNLNYFDFLWVKGHTTTVKLQMIRDFISHLNHKCVGLDPYCISLRAVNWIKFLLKNSIKDIAIDEALYRQLLILNNTREYHIMGNHLLENGFALLFGAYYFHSRKLLETATDIILKNLPKQILTDGGHYELSPMYHQIILGRILDSYSLIQSNSLIFDNDIKELLEKSAIEMLGWINQMTFDSGAIPYVNDSAPNIGFDTKDLNRIAKDLNIRVGKTQLGESGYRKFKFYAYQGCLVEVLIDVGSVKAKEQPGHSHSDVFSFIIMIDGRPFIVDTGVSTYDNCSARLLERSTQSHNTVSVTGVEPIEVWSAFRVANRAKVNLEIDSDCVVKASHDGFKQLGVIHQRTWKFSPERIIIQDEISGSEQINFDFNLHFHPNVKLTELTDSILESKQAVIKFSSNDYKIKSYNYAVDFNEKTNASKLISFFHNKHQMEILFDPHFNHNKLVFK